MTVNIIEHPYEGRRNQITANDEGVGFLRIEDISKSRVRCFFFLSFVLGFFPFVVTPKIKTFHITKQNYIIRHNV